MSSANARLGREDPGVVPSQHAVASRPPLHVNLLLSHYAGLTLVAQQEPFMFLLMAPAGTLWPIHTGRPHSPGCAGARSDSLPRCISCCRWTCSLSWWAAIQSGDWSGRKSYGGKGKKFEKTSVNLKGQVGVSQRVTHLSPTFTPLKCFFINNKYDMFQQTVSEVTLPVQTSHTVSF